MTEISDVATVLLIEPFYGGSHRDLIDTLQAYMQSKCSAITLPAKKWHWRARTSALYLSQVIPHQHNYKVLFSSSVLNMAELAALRPDLACLHKVLYFHENQLMYPVRNTQHRDFQYGYNEILSSLVADTVVFNSHYNRDTFLSSISTHLNLMPDFRPKNLREQISPKCKVIPFPVRFPDATKSKCCDKETCESCRVTCKHAAGGSVDDGQVCDCKSKQWNCDINRRDTTDKNDSSLDVSDRVSQCESDRHTSSDSSTVMSRTRPLHIVWCHRWEHDKNPESFFQCLQTLTDEGCDFRLSVMGETFSEVPSIFEEAHVKLSQHIVSWGYQPCQATYFRTLQQADVVVSTAIHEFFGVAMLEAVHCGCYPLCPNRLVYPEIFPGEYLYNTDKQLVKRLRQFCKKPDLARQHTLKIDTTKYSHEHLRDSFIQLLSAV